MEQRNHITASRFLITALLAVLLTAAGCDSKDDSPAAGSTGADPAGAEDVQSNAIQASGDEEGQIVYFSGIVDLRRAGEETWTPADIGDGLLPGDTIRTLTDAWCEIQFGNLAVVKVDADTVFTVDSIVDEETGAGRFRGSLSSGTVVSKIRKLTGNETLSVSTSTVICSVRGTIFMVSTETEETTIAVDEGRVAIAPAALAGDSAPGSLQMDAAVSETLEASYPVIEAGDQVILGARELNIIETETAEVLDMLVSGSTDPESLGVSAGRIRAALGETEKLSEENQDIMESLKRLEVGDESIEEGETLIKMSWSATPEDARILVAGAEGTGTFSGSWKAGETIFLEASRPGYRDFSEEYTAREGEAGITEIALSRLPTRYFDLSVTPPEAEILVDGAETASGEYSGAVPWGESREIVVSLEGHNTHHYWYTHEEAPEGRIDLVLEPTIRNVVSAITGSVVGLEEHQGILYISDHEGTLYALNADGERIWRRVTTNSPNDAARPHVVNGRVFFSGINEFIVLDSATGAVTGQSSQTPRTMHLLGRRSVPYGAMAVYPATDELRFIDPKDGSTTGSFTVPGGSQMTPVVHNGRVWTVAIDGTVFGFQEDGSIRARISTGADKPIAHSPALENGIIRFGDRSGGIFAVNLDTERLVWKTTIGSGEPTPVSDDLYVEDGILLVYSKGTAYLLDAETGAMLGAPIPGYAAPPILRDGFIYGGTESGDLTACAASTGQEVSRVSMNGIVRSNAAAYGNLLVFGTDQGEIYFVNPQHPSLLEVSIR